VEENIEAGQIDLSMVAARHSELAHDAVTGDVGKRSNW